MAWCQISIKFKSHVNLKCKLIACTLQVQCKFKRQFNFNLPLNLIEICATKCKKSNTTGGTSCRPIFVGPWSVKCYGASSNRATSNKDQRASLLLQGPRDPKGRVQGEWSPSKWDIEILSTSKGVWATAIIFFNNVASLQIIKFRKN